MKGDLLSCIITIDDRMNEDSNDLLVMTATQKKDIVNDILGKLPNIIPMNVQDPDTKISGACENLGVISGGRWLEAKMDKFVCFDTCRLNESFMVINKIYGDTFDYDKETKERGNLSGGIIVYAISYEKDNEFAKSAMAMVLNYFKTQKNVKIFENQNKLENVGIRGVVNPTLLSSYGSIISTEEEFKEKIMKPLGFQIEGCRYPAVLQLPEDEIQLGNEKMLEMIMQYLRGKFIMVLPVDQREIENEQETDIEKTFVDVYDIFAMDTTIGKLMTLYNITSSTVGKDSSTRTSAVKNKVVCAVDDKGREPGDYSEYQLSVLQGICSLFKEYCVLNPFK